MDLNALKSLDLKDLARAPLPIKAVVLAVLFLAILGLGWYLDWSNGMAELDNLRNEEASLREVYAQKKRQAIHYEAYKKRLADTRSRSPRFCASCPIGPRWTPC